MWKLLLSSVVYIVNLMKLSIPPFFTPLWYAGLSGSKILDRMLPVLHKFCLS